VCLPNFYYCHVPQSIKKQFIASTYLYGNGSFRLKILNYLYLKLNKSEVYINADVNALFNKSSGGWKRRCFDLFVRIAASYQYHSISVDFITNTGIQPSMVKTTKVDKTVNVMVKLILFFLSENLHLNSSVHFTRYIPPNNAGASVAY
jgi:hypothetical protein